MNIDVFNRQTTHIETRTVCKGQPDEFHILSFSERAHPNEPSSVINIYLDERVAREIRAALDRVYPPAPAVSEWPVDIERCAAPTVDASGLVYAHTHNAESNE